MQDKKDRIIWFNTKDEPESSLVGGKCLGLYKLGSYRTRVPPWFCITTNAYRHFVAANNLSRLLVDYDKALATKKDVRSLTTRISNDILSAQLPKDLAKLIKDNYREMCTIVNEDEANVSVRSSAIMEDSSVASFAGIFKTYLGVSTPESVINAVKGCWASLFSDRSLSYMRTKGMLPERIAGLSMAVVVQKMVNPEVSGIIFTVDPRATGNAESLIIESSYGLGEPIVSGRLSPDTYIINRNPITLTEKRLGTKRIYQKSSVDGAKEAVTPASKASRYSLDDKDVLMIAKLALSVERRFGSPQDIEFAVEKGNVFFLQSRPVTALKR